MGRRGRECCASRPARVSPEDVEDVFENPIRYEKSRSSGRSMVFGYTSDGRRIAVVYEQLDDTTLYPVTAYEVE